MRGVNPFIHMSKLACPHFVLTSFNIHSEKKTCQQGGENYTRAKWLTLKVQVECYYKLQADSYNCPWNVFLTMYVHVGVCKGKCLKKAVLDEVFKCHNYIFNTHTEQ